MNTQFNTLFYILILIVSTTYFCSAQQQTTWMSYTSLDTEKGFIIQDFQEIDEDSSLIGKKVGSIEYKKSYYLMNENIKLTNVTIRRAAHNMTETEISLKGESGVQLRGFNVLKGEITLDYEYAWAFYNGKGIAKVNFETSDFSFEKVYKEGLKSPEVSVSYGNFTLSMITLKGYYDKNAEVADLVSSTLTRFFFSGIQESILKEIEQDVVKNYDQSESSPIEVFSQGKLIYVDTSMTRIQRNLKQGFINHMSGAVSFDKSDFANPKLQTNLPAWSGFNESEGPHQIFIEKEFFKNVHYLLTKANAFKFELDDDMNYFKQDIGSIAAFYPDVLKNNTINETIFIQAYIKEPSNMEIINNRFVSKVVLNMSFASERTNETVFEVDAQLDLVWKLTMDAQISINLEVSTSDVKAEAAKVPTEFSNYDKVKLNQYLTEGMRNFFEKNKLSLFDLGYNLSSMMSYVQELRLTEEGVLIVGQTKFDDNDNNESLQDVLAKAILQEMESGVQTKVKFLE